MTINTSTGFTDILSDSGTATIVAGKPNLTITGNDNIDTSASGSTVTLTHVAESAFSARLDPQVDDVTGDGTVYDVFYNVEDLDVGGDYNPVTAQFVAPKDGKYLITVTNQADDIGVSHDICQYQIVKRNVADNADLHVLEFTRCQPANLRSQPTATDKVTFTGSTLIAMSAGERIIGRMIVSGSTLTIDVIGRGGSAGVPGASISGIFLGA